MKEKLDTEEKIHKKTVWTLTFLFFGITLIWVNNVLDCFTKFGGLLFFAEYALYVLFLILYIHYWKKRKAHPTG